VTTGPAASVHFVLDHNFPLSANSIPWPQRIRTSRLVNVDPTLTQGKDDWEIILKLWQNYSIDGFITIDAKMLLQSREMTALSRTGMALIIADAAGQDPIRATGLVMVHLAQIANTLTGVPQIFRLRMGVLKIEHPRIYLKSIADHTNQRVQDIIAANVTAMGLPP
jgi:hypothetical protein